MSATSDKADFKRVLRAYGFEQVPGDDTAYTNDSKGWYAEIRDCTHWSDVWATGSGLKEIPGFPGGYVYYAPTQLINELKKHF